MCIAVCVVRAARNKDNSWPEEIIAVMKEVRAKDKENKDKHEDSKSSGELFFKQVGAGSSNVALG